MSSELTAETRYAVFAEATEQQRPLLQLDLTFARLMDDIVVPYESNSKFFIDGAPVSAEKLTRIKLLRLAPSFSRARGDLDAGVTSGNNEMRRMYAEQYNARFEHLLRVHSEDVTSQVISAFNQAIKPRLKDYLPKREELISAAMKLFVEGIKALGN